MCLSFFFLQIHHARKLKALSNKSSFKALRINVFEDPKATFGAFFLYFPYCACIFESQVNTMRLICFGKSSDGFKPWSNDQTFRPTFHPRFSHADRKMTG